jgi:hypothetical protein
MRTRAAVMRDTMNSAASTSSAMASRYHAVAFDDPIWPRIDNCR